ncbi:nucleotidyltransferase domain-containing protein [Methanocella sp. MCL-LM]|uniref:nucleotidyltransferase domain-containing protein n=1 Tax=Methanocella sp. MCL-LM TaxID=3412035 RepID=UPI003C75E46F
MFDKYVDWKVLSYFLSRPGELSYANQIAKALNISPSSASAAVKIFAEKGFLVVEEKGFATLYRLDTGNEVVKSLKRAYGIDFVVSSKPVDVILKTDPNALSVALYGSYAGGSFDGESDIDFLVVTPSNKEIYVNIFRELEHTFDKDVNFTIFKLSEWRALANKKDAFYTNVVSNHILLYGAGLK